jgi:hypothetical protein
MSLFTDLSRCLVLGVGATITTLALATPGLTAPDAVAQVDGDPAQPLVLPFTDVPSDHWAYQALLNLAGVHGCISGYPDGTFRGDATVSRYEFAAGLDACLGQLSEQVVQQRQTQQREVDALIEAMEQSLGELRQLDADLPTTP